MLLQTISGIRTIEQVLPDAFGPRDLKTYQDEHSHQEPDSNGSQK
jgi:cytidine deaminase